MNVKAYTLYDVKSLTYSQPFFAPTHGAAIRIVQDVANDMNTAIGRHPNDYVLYCVGGFDDQTSVLNHLDPREHVIDVAALVTLKPTGDLFQQAAQ